MSLRAWARDQVRLLPSETSAVTLSRADLRSLLDEDAPDEQPIADLTVAQVAEELGRAPSTIRTWLARGDIPSAFRLHGREWRVPRGALAAYLRGGAPTETGAVDIGAWRRVS